MSPLVLSEILGVFVDILIVDCKCPVQHIHNLWLPIQMQLFEKLKTFSRFFFHLWNLHQILNIFNKKMIVIANLFPKLQPMKILVRGLSKKRYFRKRFDSQHV